MALLEEIKENIREIRDLAMIDSRAFSQVKSCDANGLDVKGFNIFNMNRDIYLYDGQFRKIFVGLTVKKFAMGW